MKLGIDQRVKNIIQALQDEVNGLDYYLKMLFISDAIVRTDEIDLKERKSLDTEGTLYLILSKLYELYGDDKYHSIRRILEGNGVKLNTYNEDFDLGKILESRGYADVMNTRHTMAKLNLEGKLAIEQARKAQIPDYSKISSSDEELKKLIKEVLSETKKLGYGQQLLIRSESD